MEKMAEEIAFMIAFPFVNFIFCMHYTIRFSICHSTCGKIFLRQTVFSVCFPDVAVCLHQRPKRMSFLLKTIRKNLAVLCAAAAENHAVVTVGSGCVWTLTGDFTVTSLVNNGTIIFNGCTITLADGTVMQ